MKNILVSSPFRRVLALVCVVVVATASAAPPDAQRSQRIRQHEARIKDIVEMRRIEHEADLAAGRVNPLPTPVPGAATPVPMVKPSDLGTTDPAKISRIRQHEVRIKDIVERRRLEAIERERLERLLWDSGGTLPPGPDLDALIRIRKARVLELRTRLHEEEIVLDQLLRLDGQTTATLAAARPGTVSVAGNDTGIEIIVAIINQQVPNKVNIRGRASGQRVSVLADGVPVEEVLTTIANGKGWVWWKELDGTYGLGDREYYESNILMRGVTQKVFRARDHKASELYRAIKPFLTPNVGSAVGDDPSNRLIVNDLPQVIERIERFLGEINALEKPGS